LPTPINRELPQTTPRPLSTDYLRNLTCVWRSKHR
jgi:hypothetical protein